MGRLSATLGRLLLMLEQIARSLVSGLDPLRPFGSPTLILGIVIVIAAIAWLVRVERSRPAPRADVDARRAAQPVAVWTWLAPLLVLVAAGAAARLIGIGEKSLNHMEVYIPGIPLPAGISEPPPRVDWASALWWGFFHEPHPVGFFLAMFGWTKIFGTSVEALRLPVALFGVLSIPVVYRLGRLTYGRAVGLIAAAFLAFHGFHINTSDWARMFVPETFLGLVATWLLIEILQPGRRGGYLEALYVIVAFVGFNTEWFMWALIGTHLLFVLVQFRKGRQTHRVLSLQILAMILGAYTLTQVAATAGQAQSGSRPTLTIVREFLSFGILFHNDTFSLPNRPVPWIAALGATLVAFLLWCRALSIRSVRVERSDSRMPLAWRPLCLAALGMTVVMASIPVVAATKVSNLKILAMMLIVVFPAFAVASYPVAAAIGTRAGTWFDVTVRRSRLADVLTSPMVFLALVPFAMVCAGAMIRPIVDPQALVMFVPYVLIVLAAGARAAARPVVLRGALAVALAALFATSVWHFQTTPQSPRDYAGLAAQMNARMQPNDLIFVQPRRWFVTPLFYYLDQSKLVSADYAAFASKPGTRVWVVLFSHEKLPPVMAEALAGYEPSARVESLRSSAILYERR
jgi:4-amino-4-deoxy-L-arabinose transferase-like glycosyltransferase